MNTRDLRGMKARKAIKRAVRRWARVRRILAGNQPGKPRGCVRPMYEHTRLHRAVVRALNAWDRKVAIEVESTLERTRVDWVDWDGPTKELLVDFSEAES